MGKEITQNNSGNTSTCINAMTLGIVIKKLFLSCLKQLLDNLVRVHSYVALACVGLETGP